MNLATKITMARIVFIVPTMILYALAYIFPAHHMLFSILAGILFVVLCSTDFVDGAVARKTNTVSDLGKFLDPLADKVIVVMMILLLSWQSSVLDDATFPYAGLVFVVLSGIVICRELIVGILRAIASQKGVVLAADVYGKIKTIFLDIGISVLIFAPTVPYTSWLLPLAPLVNWFGQITFFIGAFFAVLSGTNYIIKNKRNLGLDEIMNPKKNDEKSQIDSED